MPAANLSYKSNHIKS